MSKPGVKRLTAEDWSWAAVGAIARGGVAAVSVEALARELGVTKGSFYWHFADRSALITSTLDMWERLGTGAIIERLEQVADPAERLRTLLEVAFGDVEGNNFEAALAADVADPHIGPVLARVTKKRIQFLEQIFDDQGFTAPETRDRAVAAYASFVGHLQLMRVAPRILGGRAGRARYLDRLAALLLTEVAES